MTAGAGGAKGMHRWRFCRLGGVDQVLLANGNDIAALDQLDQKLWMALCMPTRGLALDPRTADLLDTDHDGHIRPPEVIAAVKWCKAVFVDPGCLMKATDKVALTAILDPQILAGAKRLLHNLGKPEAAFVSLADVSSQERIFASTRFNGDGIVPPSSAGTPELEAAIEDILRVCEGKKDRSGKTGLDTASLEQFIKEATAGLDWARRAEADPEMMPLGLVETTAAADALRKVRAKVDDYFTRCRLAAFDDRAAAPLNRDASVYQQLAGGQLSAAGMETAELPLARIAPEAPLPLDGGLNPAWTAAIREFAEKTVIPMLGEPLPVLSDAQWGQLKARLAACMAWQDSRPADAVMALGVERLRELLAAPVLDGVRDLLKADTDLKAENAQIDNIEKMTRFQRDLYVVLANYVNFSDFYGPTPAVFQAGTLYLDARACHLCIDVTEPARHAQLAALSGAFLVYCDLSRSDARKRSIVAVVTNGDSLNLGVGRNGVFYDHDSQDWSATITRMVANPISVREAFWLPYRKFIWMIEAQVTKRAQAAEEASMARMNHAAVAVSTADQATPAAVPAGPSKIELGTIALIGTAIGGMSALVGGFLHALFGLGFWLPVGLLGVVLLISGPSMLLASIKLRQRNLGPILDANGWAINTRARMNLAFGASLTALASLPPGAERTLDDPYANRPRPRRKLVLLLMLGILIWFWWVHVVDGLRRPDKAEQSSPMPAPVVQQP